MKNRLRKWLAAPRAKVEQWTAKVSAALPSTSRASSGSRWDSFEELTEALPQLVWVGTPDGAVEYFNERWYTFVGHSPPEDLGWGWIEVFHPEDKEATLSRWQESLKTSSVFEFEYRLRRQDGQYRWHLGRAYPVRDTNGTVVRWFGSCTDVHDLKVAQESLEQSEIRLQSYADELRLADQRKDHFLAVLSHELRNPLAPIRTSLEVFEQAPRDSPHAERAMEILRRQVEHMIRLVDDLLDLTRITRNKIQLRQKWVRLENLVRKAAEDRRAEFDNQDIKLELSLPTSPVWVCADAVRVEQVLGNLLNNARENSVRRGRVSIRLQTEGERAVLRVTNSGRGIPEEMIPKVFEPFAQIPSRSPFQQQGLGLGLGLAIVKELIELHGGKVSAQSGGGDAGAELVVELPAARDAPAQPRQLEAAVGDARRVLVIEDNLDAALSLRDQLELYGHDVRVAETGEAGIDVAERFMPDVIICDIGLPNLDGYGVARSIRSNPRLQSVGLIALSGYAFPADVAKAADAGFDHHLAKPPEGRILLSVLERAALRRLESESYAHRSDPGVGA